MTLQESMLQVLQTNTINSTPWMLADCILRLGPRLAKMSITELAHQCNVSEPTVSRFVVAAGFRNYTDMRDSAKKERLALKSSGFHISETKLNLIKNEPKEYLRFFLAASLIAPCPSSSQMLTLHCSISSHRPFIGHRESLSSASPPQD
ncbi:hypothetical protein [Lacticaseibacillus camelliae]|uniref:hypothetical protein n=1 Tax=Lacticaseibacillus camelliae TaxID=381742 RepID=UPI0009EBE88E